MRAGSTVSVSSPNAKVEFHHRAGRAGGELRRDSLQLVVHSPKSRLSLCSRAPSTFDRAGATDFLL